MSTYLSQQLADEYVGFRQQANLSYLRPDSPLPLVVRPAVKGANLIEWTAANTLFIESYLKRNGAILFRDFGLLTIAEFERLIEVSSGPLMDYSYRSTPRTVISGKIYSSTEYPALARIPLMRVNVFPALCCNKLGTFSRITYGGSLASMIEATLKNKSPWWVHSNPNCWPAFEKGWHGNPAHNMS